MPLLADFFKMLQCKKINDFHKGMVYKVEPFTPNTKYRTNPVQKKKQKREKGKTFLTERWINNLEA